MGRRDLTPSRHLAPGHAFLRREFINYGYMTREAGTYRLADHAPERDGFWAQERPEWEQVWLPCFLQGR